MQTNHLVRYASERLILRLLWVLLAALFLLAVVPALWQLFSPFLVALPIAALLQPCIRFFQEKLHFKRGLAVTFWVLFVCVAAFFLLYWFVSFLVVQVMNAANNAPQIINSVISVLQDASNRILGAAETLPTSFGVTIRDSLDSGFKSLSDAGLSLASGLVNFVINFAAGLPLVFVYANFLVLGIFFLTGRYHQIQAFFQKRSQRSPSRSAAHETSGENIAVLRQSAIKGMLGYIRVQLLFLMLTFLLSWVYFQSFGFEYAMLIGAVAAFLEMIPQFGCGMLYIPWAAVSFVIGSNDNGWIVLGLYLGYSVLRRVTEPMLLGTNLGVSPLYSLIGMFVGMQLAGVVGLIAGPIVMVVLVSAVRAHLFDSIIADCQTVSHYMKVRWKRGQKEIYNAEK